MEKIHGVIFDMDGVIFDTERLWKDAFESANIKFGLNLTEEYRQSTCGKSEEVIRAELNQMYSTLDTVDYREFMLNEVRTNIDNGSFEIKPGFEELISYLKSNEYKIALATSSHKDRAEKLFYIKHLNINEVFDSMVFAEDIGKRSKPDPYIFTTAAQRIGLLPSECYVIEDSINGIEASFKGGFNSIMVVDLIPPNEFCLSNSKIFDNLTTFEIYMRNRV